MSHILLASASPRRRQLLESLGFSVTVSPASVDETLRPEEDTRGATLRLAIAKAQAVARSSIALDVPRGTVVLGADTLVSVDGEKLEKPTDVADAERMLRRLSGRSHAVTTAWAIFAPGESEARDAGCVDTVVRFREVTDAEIRSYVATGEPMDKAGGYGIQGLASVFVTGIDGSWSNVVGLPVEVVVSRLLALGMLQGLPWEGVR